MPRIVDHEQQRRSLAATVVEVLALQGMEHATLRTVATAHGCTKGMVQHYYADKEALLLAALSLVEQSGERRIQDMSGQRVGLDCLQARLQAQLPLAPDTLKECRVRLLFSIRAVSSRPVRAIIDARAARHQKAGLACLRQAQRSGELRHGVSHANAYRSLTALVCGLAVKAVGSTGGLSPVTQRQTLQKAMDALRC